MIKYFYILTLLLILAFSAHVGNLEGRITQLTGNNMNNEIHHCTSCGFRAKASVLAEEIYTELGLKADVIEDQIGSFDVYINGSLIFSKSEVKRFPEPGEIVQKIKEYNSSHDLSTTREEP